MKIAILFLLLLLHLKATVSADDLAELAREFWEWRALHQPLSGDDIPRIERQADWLPDWSATTLAQRRQTAIDFEQRWKQIKVADWPVPKQVDYRLIGSAISRVHWELELLRSWRRDPTFYLDQTLGAIFDRLLQPPPFDATRSAQILRRMANIPRTIQEATANLDEPVAPFASLAIEQLRDVRSRLQTVSRELKSVLAPESAAQMDGATERAIQALEFYRDWLQQHLPSMAATTSIGPQVYEYFLRRVALLPFTPEQLLAMGRQEWERSVAFETYEKNRNEGLPQLSIPLNQTFQMVREEWEELAIRRLLTEKDLLTVPRWVQHYRNLPLPSYLEPLKSLGVTDDLTSANRLTENGISYIPVPGPALSYFYLATARDPRMLLVHEGIPGHYLQMVLSWAHENPIRRHYYDSAVNEGIGFYSEEMMLQAGLFDNSPRTREMIYNFMRLRALRVEVDVKLALGEFTIFEATEYLENTVPMDHPTAVQEAAFFAASPGQAICYQIGKLQILKFLAAARRMHGDAFHLRVFHDFIWKNGNVPLSLQRWEYLGLKDEIESLDQR